MNTFDINSSQSPKPNLFQVSDGQTFGVEFKANNAKEFEIEIKKIALSSIPKNSFIKEVQVKNFDGKWLTNNSLINKFGNGISLNVNKVDFDFYYEKLVTKAKGSWVMSHVSLTPKTKPNLKLNIN